MTVGAYQFTVRFDPSLLSLASTGVTGGAAPFNNPPIAVNIDNFAGEVTVNAFQIGGVTSGTVAVARLGFTPKAAGTSTLTILQGTVFNTAGDALPDAVISLSTNSVTVR